MRQQAKPHDDTFFEHRRSQQEGGTVKHFRKRWGEPTKAMVQWILAAVMVVALLAAAMPSVVMSEHIPAQPASHTAEARLGPPTANLEVENTVPFDLVEQIALKKAQGLWGPGALGEPLLCADDDGDIVAYMFPFATGKEVFPTYEEILQGVKEGRRLAEEGLEAMSEAERSAIYQIVEQEMQDLVETGTDAVALQQITSPEEMEEMLTASAEKRAKRLGQEKSFGVGEYGTVVVSARYDRFPIPVCWGYLPHYYTMGDLALEKAGETLGSSNAVLTRSYFLGLGHGQWFEFASGGGTVLMRAQSLDIEPADEVLVYRGNKVVPDPAVQSAMDEEWQRLEAEAFAAGDWASSMHAVDNSILIPTDVQWCRGCTPTSASMVLGYYDNYDYGMSVAGFGRLIDHWLELTMYSDGTGSLRNVPNILEELRIDMKTDVGGGTKASNIGPGMMRVTNIRSGYSFSTSQTRGDSDNDWAWGKIVSEINDNRPFVWSVASGDVAHSLCAWGWTDDKYVICYDTWGPVDASLWYYNKYDNGPTADAVLVDTAVPGGADGDQNLVILQPDGGETLTSCGTYPIQWHQSGTQMAKVDLFYSTNGGLHWNDFAIGVPSSEGVNTYDWSVPNEPGDRVRVVLRGWTADDYCVAFDGSYQNLTITDSCDLTIAVDGSGTTIPSPGTHTYGCCTDVNVKAIETNACWEFSHWSGAAVGTSPTVTIPMDGHQHQSVTAHFTKKKFDLITNVSGTGTTSPSPGTHTYDCGTDVAVTAIETDPCWEFNHWGANAGFAPDQVQEGTNYGFMFDDDVILWQEFKPTLTSLTRLHLYIARNGSPGNLRTAVKDGDGDVLWETTVSQPNVVSGWNSIQVHPAVTLVAESSYYIYVWSDRDSPSPDNRYGWMGQTDSPYRRGISSVEKIMPKFDFAFATEGWRTDNPISIHMDDDKSATAQFRLISQPDLDITEKLEEWESLAHKTYAVTYTVKNIGGAKAGASKTCIEIDGELKVTDPVPELDPGATYTNTVGPFAMTGCDGDKIEACADCDDEVTECDEENNCLENDFENPCTCGDVDCDGEITMNDGRQIFMYLIYGEEKYPICDFWAADCDGIKGITMNDGRQIFMHLIYGPVTYPLQCR